MKFSIITKYEQNTNPELLFLTSQFTCCILVPFNVCIKLISTHSAGPRAKANAVLRSGKILDKVSYYILSEAKKVLKRIGANVI